MGTLFRFRGGVDLHIMGDVMVVDEMGWVAMEPGQAGMFRCVLL